MIESGCGSEPSGRLQQSPPSSRRCRRAPSPKVKTHTPCECEWCTECTESQHNLYASNKCNRRSKYHERVSSAVTSIPALWSRLKGERFL